ncbi:DUF5694 domain-containing protein [Halobacillus salinarum]|uniref:DUF5694 domain-containing protein n=1 Tax=Halobacillus salinarum TaxID=2932257 RepID=A0ABY4EH82_9BACI|nr:DUF5694 domain-containing protein [Halobacillus salinarum]UOQ43821.1 DUF5694 domain-containing protein [Halobacillus salinarum]
MDKPIISLLGCPHLALSPEIVNLQQEDIHSVIKSLKAFRPTKIAVEKPFLVDEELNKNYAAFLHNNGPLSYDESEQLGFRLAAHFNHSKLYPVDEPVEMSVPSLDTVFSWLKNEQQELLEVILQLQSELKDGENNETLLHTLQSINKPAYSHKLQRMYLKLAQAGDRHHPLGVQWLSQWYKRDLAITANLTRIAENQDRILVLLGSDHLHIVSQLLSDSGDFHMVSPLSYLQM